MNANQLLAKLELSSLRKRKLRWFGHVECSSGAVRRACDIEDGRFGPERPKITKKWTENVCCEFDWKFKTVHPQKKKHLEMSYLKVGGGGH